MVYRRGAVASTFHSEAAGLKPPSVSNHPPYRTGQFTAPIATSRYFDVIRSSFPKAVRAHFELSFKKRIVVVVLCLSFELIRTRRHPPSYFFIFSCGESPKGEETMNLLFHFKVCTIITCLSSGRTKLNRSNTNIYTADPSRENTVAQSVGYTYRQCVSKRKEKRERKMFFLDDGGVKINGEISSGNSHIRGDH